MTSNNLAKAVRDTLISPNEVDRNEEPANVVDALFAIARGLDRIADNLDPLIIHKGVPHARPTSQNQR